MGDRKQHATEEPLSVRLAIRIPNDLLLRIDRFPWPLEGAIGVTRTDRALLALSVGLDAITERAKKHAARKRAGS